MYKHCITEESVHRQRQLEGCLLEMMQDTPYNQITIGHLCDTAGISRKSFYRYFGSKEGCLCALIDHCIIDEGSLSLPAPGAQIASAQYEPFFTYWKQMGPLLHALVRNDLAALLVERMVYHVDQEEWDFRHYLGSGHDTSEQVLFMVSGLVGLILYWHSTGFQKSPAQMADILNQIINK